MASAPHSPNIDVGGQESHFWGSGAPNGSVSVKMDVCGRTNRVWTLKPGSKVARIHKYMFSEAAGAWIVLNIAQTSILVVRRAIFWGSGAHLT